MSANFSALLRRACRGTSLRYAGGKTVFRRGDPVRFLYLVEEGQVRLARVLAKGQEIALAHLGPGGIVAEASVFAAHYHCDAVTEGGAVLRCFAMSDVTSWLRNHAEAAAAYGAHLAGELMDLRARAELRTIRRADERLLCWLRLRAGGSPAVFTAPGGWRGAAREIGLAPESLYRALAKLERDRRIVRDGRKVTLTSSPRRPALARNI